MDLIITILMLTSVTSVTAVTLGCPPNLANSQYLRHFGTHCYQFVLNRHDDWLHAKTDCRNKGGYLVDIHSLSENAFIYNTLQILGLHGDKGVWIGLNDRDKEGSWQWTSGTNVNYRNWGSGQPGILGGSENCALLEKNGHWGDYPCHGLLFLKQSHGWICKFGEVPLTTKYMSTMTTTTPLSSTTMKMMASSTLMSTLVSTRRLSTMPSTSMSMLTSTTPMNTMVSSSLKPMASSTNTNMSSTQMESTISTTFMDSTISSTLMDSTISSTIIDSTISSTPMTVPSSIMDSTVSSTPVTVSTTLMDSTISSSPMSSSSDTASKQTKPMTTLKMTT